ncbi:S24 family peptidase [Sphingomonas soli]|uniref:S24 family peptidase n=1 Tax=Sphingomonas soli TaxID=266127 RepID=UPI000830AA0A|nr:S24 family peptidase [Sphingomonas soli]
MKAHDPRTELDRLITEGGHSYASISRLLGRNAAYVQQFIKRGTPGRLEEEDRGLLARFFGVSEDLLGGQSPAPASLTLIPRFAVLASAGAGSMVDGELSVGQYGFDPRWLRSLTSSRPEQLSIISVTGDSMSPLLNDGDDVLVDSASAAQRLRDGVYVLRRDDTLMIKRLSLHPGSGTLTIASDNPAYPTWRDCPLNTVDIVGRVLWAGRRLR